jgi:hypothetical protein
MTELHTDPVARIVAGYERRHGRLAVMHGSDETPVADEVDRMAEALRDAADDLSAIEGLCRRALPNEPGLFDDGVVGDVRVLADRLTAVLGKAYPPGGTDAE